MELRQEKFATYLQELQLLQSETDFYEYEKKFVSIHNKFGKSMLELNVAEHQVSANNKVYKKKF